jgi:hypothetical protein
MVEMNKEELIAYNWALKQGFNSVAARYARFLAKFIERARQYTKESPENSPASPVQQLHPEIAPTIMRCFQQMGYGDAKDSAALAARVVAQLSGV